MRTKKKQYTYLNKPWTLQSLCAFLFIYVIINKWLAGLRLNHKGLFSWNLKSSFQPSLCKLYNCTGPLLYCKCTSRISMYLYFLLKNRVMVVLHWIRPWSQFECYNDIENDMITESWYKDLQPFGLFIILKKEFLHTYCP